MIMSKILFLSLVLSAKPSWALPSISSYSGFIRDGQQMSISGTGFGDLGPSIVIFDDFNGGAAGNEIPLTSPKVSSWTITGTYHPAYSSLAHSGTSSMRTANGVNMLQFGKTFSPATEVFASFWVRVPPGTNFPGVVGTPRSFYSPIQESYVIPASPGPFTVTVAAAYGSYNADLGVTNTGTGQSMTRATSNPAAGQYSQTDKVYTFSSADAGKSVQIRYNTRRSSWKMIWFMDGASGFSKDDNITFPSWTGAGWILGSNNNMSVIFGTDNGVYSTTLSHISDQSNRPVTGAYWQNYWRLNSTAGIKPYPWSSAVAYAHSAGWFPGNGISSGQWWTWDNWMRIAQWYKAGANPTADIGSSFLQLLNEGVTQKYHVGPTLDGANRPTSLFATANGDNVPRFDRVTFPGWILVNPGVEPVYDDIYISAGPGAQARVEIGDAPNYSNCTNLTLATINHWSDFSITATLRQGSFKNGDSAYLFVIDAEGNTSDGKAITIGNGIVSGAPAKPKGLRIK